MAIWRDAMKNEVDAFKINDTLDITTLPLGKKPLRNKWIFKNNFHFDGTLERHKAMLVVLENNQEEEEDLNETCCPNC